MINENFNRINPRRIRRDENGYPYIHLLNTGERIVKVLTQDDTATTAATASLATSVILPKTSGSGVLIDNGYAWADLLGDMKSRSPSTEPSFAQYNGSIYAYRFPTATGVKEMFVEFHIPHDYLPNSALHLHAHWSQNVVDTGGSGSVPGNCKWMFDFTYAKGHGGGAFSTVVSSSVVQQASAVQYTHNIAEVQISSLTPNGNQFSSSLIQVDGLLLVRVYRNSNESDDTLDQPPFLHFVDVHYQSTNVGTKNKAPDFYT